MIGSEHECIWRRVTETSISARCIRECGIPVIVVPWVPDPSTDQMDIDLDAELFDQDHRQHAGVHTATQRGTR